MRRKDREMPPEFALTVADKCEYAVISMTDISGEPYCVPVTIARDGNAVYFHSAKEGQKITALRANPGICMACVGDTNLNLRSYAEMPVKLLMTVKRSTLSGLYASATLLPTWQALMRQ